MLYSLSGKIALKKKNFIVIEVSGIGFKIFVSERTLKNLGKVNSKAKVFCYLNFNQNGAEIFGFNDEKELETFELLTSVSGVGPKSALGILGKMKIEKLLTAIIHGKIDSISDGSGVGRKKAERIVLELKGRTKGIQADGVDSLDDEKEIKAALEGLGYRKKDIDRAIEALTQHPKAKTIEEKLKTSLRLLNKK